MNMNCPIIRVRLIDTLTAVYKTRTIQISVADSHFTMLQPFLFFPQLPISQIYHFPLSLSNREETDLFGLGAKSRAEPREEKRRRSNILSFPTV